MPSAPVAGSVTAMPSKTRDPHDTHFRAHVLPILTSDRLYRFVLRLVHHEHDAEEIVQRTAVRAWEYRSHLVCGTSPRSWVYVIARHEAYRHASQQRSRRYHRWADVDVDSLAHDHIGPEDAIDTNRERAMVRAVVSDLSREKRATVECRYMREMSIRETADDLGIAPGTAMSRSYRARAEIREALGA